MSADVSELLQYASQIASTADRVEPELSKVVERGGLNVKRESVRIFDSYSRRAYLKHYPRSMSYDMVGPLEVEIGPDASKPQGGMGRGVEFGSVHTEPMPHLFPALDLEVPRVQKRALPILARSMR